MMLASHNEELYDSASLLLLLNTPVPEIMYSVKEESSEDAMEVGRSLVQRSEHNSARRFSPYERITSHTRDVSHPITVCLRTPDYSDLPKGFHGYYYDHRPSPVSILRCLFN